MMQGLVVFMTWIHEHESFINQSVSNRLSHSAIVDMKRRPKWTVKIEESSDCIQLQDCSDVAMEHAAMSESENAQ
jgi:hypothetical protein